MNHTAHIMHNWLPYKLAEQDGARCCHWLAMGDVKFEEPFFEHSLSKMKALSQNVKPFRQTGLMELLPSWAQGLETVSPAAFIFHLSRCGSTLVTQSFCIDPENIVLSEVPFFDEILRMPAQEDTDMDAGKDAWLCAAIQFHGQKRTGIEKRSFIKTDCWHIFFYEKLRKLFPQVPFIFLYRDPAEVLRSQQKRRGMQAVPGMIAPELMGLNSHELDFNDFDGYFSQVMEKILERFYQLLEKDPLALPVNYKEGIAAILQQIADFSGYTISEQMTERIRERSRYHAKYPEQVFAEEQKAISTPPQLDRALHWYQLLEEKRMLTALNMQR